MNELKYAYRRLLRHKRLNIIKILSLGIGLGISFVMLSKVAFEASYDTSFSDSDRIYRILTKVERNGEQSDYKSIPAAVAPGMKTEIPQILSATRYTGISGNSRLYTQDRKEYAFSEAVLADESFFDLFDQKILMGSPKEILSTKGYCMISDKIAKKIGGDVIGQDIILEDYPSQHLIIGGVFESLPLNSSIHPIDILVSLPSIGDFTWDGRDNWIGNDRYRGYVKLDKGIKPSDLSEAIYKMQQKYQDIDTVDGQIGGYMRYELYPLLKLHFSDSHLYSSVILIGIIGLVILIMSILNYSLLHISSILSSNKSTAIMKSVGASPRDILKSTLSDTVLHLLFSSIVAAIFLFLTHKELGQVLDLQVSELLSPFSILMGVVILLFTGLVITISTTKMMASQPIITMMTNHKKNNRKWKLSLLFIESIGVTFLLCTVYFVQRQYGYSIDLNKGYNTDKVYYVPTSTIDSLGIKSIADVLRNTTEVEVVSLTTTLPFDNHSGDNIIEPETEREILHITDFFWCDEHYFDTFKIPIIEGAGFDTQPCHSKHMLISRSCAIQLALNMQWTDGVIGKKIHVTSHTNPVTIIGVFEDLLSKGYSSSFPEKNPIVIAGGAFHRYCSYIAIRMRDDSPSALSKVEEIINRYSLYGNLRLSSATKEVYRQYDGIQQIGYYTLFGSIIALLIVVIGIIGHTEEEMTRRSKELAIRMVNGATTKDILHLFVTEYAKVTAPAILIGLILAYYATKTWMMDFPDHIDLSVFVLLLLGCAVMLLTCLIMGLYCYFMSRRNPIVYLSEE